MNLHLHCENLKSLLQTWFPVVEMCNVGVKFEYYFDVLVCAF